MAVRLSAELTAYPTVPRSAAPAPMLIDTHCHLADPAYDADRPEVLERAWAGGLARVVVIGESPGRGRARPGAGRGRAAARGHRRRPSPRRLRWSGRGARLAARHAPATPRWSRPARWGSTTTTTTRPAPASAAPSRPSSPWRAEAGKPAVIHAREADDDVAAILARAPGRHRDPALVQQRPGALAGGAGPQPLCVVQRDGHLQELAAGPGDPGHAAGPAAGGDRRSLPGAGAAPGQAERAGLRPPGRRADRGGARAAGRRADRRHRCKCGAGASADRRHP